MLLTKETDIPTTEKETARRVSARRRGADQTEEYGMIIHIDISKIIPNRLQPRLNFESNSTIRLADSIRRYGILQPLTVRRKESPLQSDEDTLYEIVAGERRFRAAKIVGMKTVPCILITADDKKSAELALIENLLREDLNIFETARAIKKLIDSFELTQEEVAKRLSMSQSSVANKLRLLKYTAEEERLILENHLTERHARAILKLNDPILRISAIKVVIKSRLNVSATESYVDKLLAADDEPESDIICRRKPVIKDIRIFYNSLDHSLDILRSAGINASSKKAESEDGIKIEISIPNPR